jgi:hypothetical protein
MRKLSFEEKSTQSNETLTETDTELQQLKEIIKLQRDQIDKLTEALTKN